MDLFGVRFQPGEALAFIEVAPLRAELSVGERPLERQFLERVGLSPKAFERI